MSAPADACLEDYDQRDDGTVPALDALNAGWARLALEDRDDDEVIAERQDEVDRCAARGDHEGAEAALAHVRDMQDRRDRGIDDDEERG